MELEVKLQVFEGPLDLLLHLIEKNKVDIYDIPIVEITEQYLDYVSKMPKDDLDLASEFLVMAATLIDIKSKMLLPKEVAKYAPPVDLDNLLKDVDLEKLNEIFKMVLKRQMDKIDPVRSTFGKIEMEEVSLPEKIDYVANKVKKKKRCSFKQLLEEQSSKMEVIVSFLAVLELIKIGQIEVHQERTFDDIYIDSIE